MKLLPPKVVGPISECNGAIQIEGQLSGSTLEVYADESPIAEKKANSSRTTVSLGDGVSLEPGQQITASQTVNGETSQRSPDPVVVQEIDSEAVGPVYFTSPVFLCSRCIAVGPTVPGATVEVRVRDRAGNEETLGTTTTSTTSAVVRLSKGPKANEWLIAKQVACGHEGPSTRYPHPEEMPNEFEEVSAPAIEQPLSECQTFVRISNIIPGADVFLTRDGETDRHCFAHPFVDLYGIPPLEAGENISVSQDAPDPCSLIQSNESEDVVTAVDQPSPPAVIESGVCARTTRITVTDLYPGSRVKLFVDGAEIGTGQAPPDGSTFDFPVEALTEGILTATQELCGIWSPASNEVRVVEQAEPPAAPAIAEPVVACAGSLHVDATRGDRVVLHSERLGAPVGEALVTADDGVNVPVGPALIPDDTISATATRCGSTSDHSEPVQVSPALYPPPPSVERPKQHAYGVGISNIVPGALVEVYLNGRWIESKFCSRSSAEFAVPRALEVGDRVKARQHLCAETSEFSTEVEVLPPPPECSFNVSDYTVNPGDVVQFTNTSEGVIDSYEWRFGDRSPPVTTENPTHVYDRVGTFSAKLTATGPGGADECHQNIKVYVGTNEIHVYNCNSDLHTMHVWLYREDTATWTESGTVKSEWKGGELGGCNPTAPLIVKLEEKKRYIVRVVEPENQFCESGNNPHELGCVIYEQGLEGDKEGVPQKILL